MSNQIEDIKNRLDIVEVVGGYIKLQKCGINYRACCPFHSEKKPSFFVSPSRQSWHCFGCSKGGDIFGFVKEIEGIEFGDALKMLAAKAGVELKPVSPEFKTKRNKLYDICELSCKFFEKQLEGSKIGQEARAYLLERGITGDSIGKWRLGYAPDKPKSLIEFLTSKGFEEEEISKAGLASRSERGGYFDRFQSRIIFPVFDLNSQVIGFGGRIFGERAKNEIAKYLNTPATFLYDKSRVVYGLDKARVPIRMKNSVILVEGYTDCIMAHQVGSENTVATSGTALTSWQLKILKRYSSNLITAFDMDLAGGAATKRGIDLAQSLDFNIKVLTMPEGKDPADVILESSDFWKKIVNQAKSILEFYFETTFLRFDKENPEEKKEISNILLPVIKRIPNRIVKFHWLQKLASNLGVRVEDVEREMEKAKEENREFEEKEEAVSIKPKTRKEKIEERLLTLLFRTPDFYKELTEEYLSLMDERNAALISKFKESLQKESEDFKTAFASFQNNLTEEEISFVSPLVLQAEIEEECSEMDPRQEALFCLSEIKEFRVRDELSIISSQIRKAEEEKDFEKINTLIKKFNELSKKLNNK